MDSQINCASPAAQPGNIQLFQVNLIHELDPLSLNLNPPSSGWKKNEPSYQSDARLPPLPLLLPLSQRGELHHATAPHLHSSTKNRAPTTMAGSQQDATGAVKERAASRSSKTSTSVSNWTINKTGEEPFARLPGCGRRFKRKTFRETHHRSHSNNLPSPNAVPSGLRSASRTIAKGLKAKKGTCGKKAWKAQGGKEMQTGYDTAPSLQHHLILTGREYFDNRPSLPRSPVASVARETCSPPLAASGASVLSPLCPAALGPMPQRRRPTWPPSRNLSANGSCAQSNLRRNQAPARAPGVPISCRTLSHQNAVLADMLFENGQRALSLQLAQNAHALQHCQGVQHWHALKYAEVSHDDEVPQNAGNQHIEHNLDAPPQNTPYAQAMDGALGAQETLSAPFGLGEHDPEDVLERAWRAVQVVPQAATTAVIPPQGAAHTGGSELTGASDPQLLHCATPQVCSPPAAPPASTLGLLKDFAPPPEPDSAGVAVGADFLTNLV